MQYFHECHLHCPPDAWATKTFHPYAKQYASAAHAELASKTERLRARYFSDAEAGRPVIYPQIAGPKFWKLANGAIIAEFTVGSNAGFLVMFSRTPSHGIENSGFISRRTQRILYAENYRDWDALLDAAE